MRQVEFGIGPKFLLITLITFFDRFVSHLNMFINCPNALLQVGFVQSLVCCNFNPEICQSLSVNVYGVKSADRIVCTLNLPSCDVM